MTFLPKTETKGENSYRTNIQKKIRGHCPYSDFVLKQNIHKN